MTPVCRLPPDCVDSDGSSLWPRLDVLQIRDGHTVLLDRRLRAELRSHHHSRLILREGLLRVAIAPIHPESEPIGMEPAAGITLAFLQAHDWFSLDGLDEQPLQLHALSTTRLVADGSLRPPQGVSSLQDWILDLFRLRHLQEAEERIQALMRILVLRLGRRCGAWYELPLRLTHAELAQLTGHNRVTVTRQLSRWRELGLIDPERTAGSGLRLAPRLVEI